MRFLLASAAACRNVKCPCFSSTRRFVRSLCLYTLSAEKLSSRHFATQHSRIWFFATLTSSLYKNMCKKMKASPEVNDVYCVVSLGLSSKKMSQSIHCITWTAKRINGNSNNLFNPRFQIRNFTINLIMNGGLNSTEWNVMQIQHCQKLLKWTFWCKSFFASAAASLVLPMKPDRQHFWDESKRQEEEEGRRRRRRRRGFLIMSDVWANSLLCSCRLLVG